MPNPNTFALSFIIDKLTNSIENSISGESFPTIISLVNADNKRNIKKSEWVFDWHKEFKNSGNEIYMLTTSSNPSIIQGLICLTDKKDHIFMHLIESAKFNKGRKKLYRGVAGNLIAFACKMAFDKKYDGVVSFIAKTQLIDHYKQTLGATQFGGSNRMYIDTNEARMLVNQYFQDGKY